MAFSEQLALIKTKYKPRILFLLSLLLIAIIFTIVAVIAYDEFYQDAIKKEYSNQKKTARTIGDELKHYFDILRFITQNAAIQPAFKLRSTQEDENILRRKINIADAKKIIAQEKVTTLLTNPKDLPVVKLSPAVKELLYQNTAIAYHNYLSSISNTHYSPSATQNLYGCIHKKTLKELDENIVQDAERVLNIIYHPNKVLDISSEKASKLLKQGVYMWQLTKGLPLKDSTGKAIATQRRKFARSILATYNDIYNLFQVTVDGDLIFLEPYRKQLESPAINFSPQYYLRLVRCYNKPITSEVYLSHDFNKTQLITVVSCVLNHEHECSSIIGASVASNTLQKRIFDNLLKNRIITDGSSAFLIDRYAHVVASSSGKYLYKHISNQPTDLNDPGNFRNLPIFKTIKFQSDDYNPKRNNKTTFNASFHGDLLQPIYQSRYQNPISKQDVIGTFLPISLDGIKYNWGVLIETPTAQVLANSFYLKRVFYIAGALLVLILCLVFLATIRNFSRLESKIQQKEKEVIKLATQTAHDIRSPVVVLNTLLGNVQYVNEENKIAVHHSISRISDIANNLLTQYKKTAFKLVENESIEPELIALLVERIISEKQIRYQHYSVNFIKELPADCYGAFARVNQIDFSRALSNLIDNAVEAIAEKGLILVKMIVKAGVLKLFVIDNGSGIPRHLLSRIGKGQMSLGKSGTGLGLSSAITYFEAWGGALDIRSEVNKGTTIEITLPQAKAPDWFVSVLRVKQESMIVVLDDNISIHSTWKQRFNTAFTLDDKIKFEFFSCPEHLLNTHVNFLGTDTLYLIDYEFSENILTGLDIIERLNIFDSAILVTSQYEDDIIQQKCKAGELRAIPKSYLTYIPIEVICINPELILIDDNTSITSCWKIAAKGAGKKIATFNTIQDFIQLMDFYSKDTAIYIDSDLNESIKGEIFAKMLYEKGYHTIYLSTGYDENHFANMPWISKIVSKEPPFIFKGEST